jgi:ABC-type uncharacterized transport system auxiliary subunit
MKKLLVIVAVAAMFAACGGNKTEQKDTTAVDTTAAVVADTAAADTAAADTAAPAVK